MQKFLLTLVLLLISKFALSQPDSVLIGIDGLTCSMCSYSVQSMIKKVPDVLEVKMDLNANEATITLKADTAPDLALLVKKVYDAGFSVRSLHVYLDVRQIEWEQTAIRYEAYKFDIPAGKAPDQNVIVLKIVDENFFSKKGFKRFFKTRDAEENDLLNYKAVFVY